MFGHNKKQLTPTHCSFGLVALPATIVWVIHGERDRAAINEVRNHDSDSSTAQVGVQKQEELQ